MTVKANKKSLVVKCIVTGVTKKLYGAGMAKRIAKFGTAEAVGEYFVVPAAKKLLKQGKSVDEVRKILKCPNDLPPVDAHVLARLKLLRKRRSKLNNGIDAEAVVKESGFGITKVPERFSSFQHYVEEVSGGPNKCQIGQGGTCIRPDLFLDVGCPECMFVKYCLCTLKKEKQKR